MRDHVHLVAGALAAPGPAQWLGDFKSYASRALNRHFGKPLSGTWWTESGSKRKKASQSAIRAAIEYVKNQKHSLFSLVQ